MQKKTTFGLRLVTLRGAMRQADFAAKYHVHKNTYGKYEREDREPSWAFLQNLTKSGVNVNWLLTGEGPMMRSESEVVRFAALDQKLLEDVIQYAEEALAETGRILAPDKKALLFRLLYEELQEREGKMDLKKLDAYLKLASTGKTTTES